MENRVREFMRSDLAVLLLLALASVIIHTGTNGQYGFHRDELQTLDDARWWVAIGFALGLGMETRYTAGFWTLGIVAGVLLSDARKYLASKWLWIGVGISVALFLPNVIWQAKHDFISLDFLKHLHERDVRQGRNSGFLLNQIYLCVNLVTAPLVICGMWFLSAREHGEKYALVGWTVL